MKLTEVLLAQYAKKILGFAYKKTGNSFEAEDLSQEILLQLLISLNNMDEIENLNSFIYTVCCYTWSKYLRKHKKHWNYAELSMADNMIDINNMELDAVNRILCKKLRKCIASLAKTQREIIIMYYYENKTTAEISNILNINDNTVRWHLSNIKKDLKEKMNMREKLDIRPLSLSVGIDGQIENDSNFRPLQEDLLVQNIAIACYGEPIDIKELSEKLNVASAYLERPIELLTYMDFLKQRGKKYQTNFFIKDHKVLSAEIMYGYENARPYAERLWNAVMERREDLLSIDYFNKNNIKSTEFLWFVLLKTAQELTEYGVCELLKKYKITDRPLRKDGSNYWVIANIQYPSLPELDNLQQNYAKYRICYGYKSSQDDFCTLYQGDTSFLSLYDLPPRIITIEDKLMLVQLINSIQRKKEFSYFEKIMVSEFIEKGYLSIQNEDYIVNIPVLSKKQWKELENIISNIKDTLGQDFLKNYILGFGNVMESLIPNFLDKNIRNYHKYAVMSGFDIFAHFIKESVEGGKCQLKIPDKQAAKYAMTMLILNE